jgi:hypothetical protein
VDVDQSTQVAADGQRYPVAQIAAVNAAWEAAQNDSGGALAAGYVELDLITLADSGSVSNTDGELPFCGCDPIPVTVGDYAVDVTFFAPDIRGETTGSESGNGIIFLTEARTLTQEELEASYASVLAASPGFPLSLEEFADYIGFPNINSALVPEETQPVQMGSSTFEVWSQIIIQHRFTTPGTITIQPIWSVPDPVEGSLNSNKAATVRIVQTNISV